MSLIEDTIQDLAIKIVKVKESKLDKSEADIFQNEFERIVKKMEEMSHRMDRNHLSRNPLEDSSLYKTGKNGK